MFIIRDDLNRESAPMDAAAIQALMKDGRLPLNSWVRRLDDSAWLRLRDMPELNPSSAIAAPVPSPSSPETSHPIAPGVIKTSRMAIASLVCGLLGLFSCGLTGIAGLILGIRALSVINKNKSTLGGKRLAIAGIILSGVTIILLPISAGLLLPSLAKAKGHRAEISCLSNMKQIALAVRIYSGDHNDTFPASLNLLENELTNPKLLICPGDSAHTPFPMGISWSGLGPQNISYQYLLPGAEEEKTPFTEIMLVCPVHGTRALMDASVHLNEPESPHRR